MNIFYVVRHGQAQGQQPDAPLTRAGITQAQGIADVLAGFGIDRIVSSSYRRAIDSIRPLAEHLKVPIEIDERLVEATLSCIEFPDWLERLRATFDDLDVCYEGGESGREATQRVKDVVDAVLQSSAKAPLFVTHGRLMSLLRQYDNSFNFDSWQSLSNPDLFRVTLQRPREPEVIRLWNES